MTVVLQARECNTMAYRDLCGPLLVACKGVWYFMTFITDYSRKAQVYILNTKADAINMFRDFTLQCLLMHHFVNLLLTKVVNTSLTRCITSYWTSTWSMKPLNGTTEQFNQTILNMVCCMLHDIVHILNMTSGHKCFKWQ
jgi:hypothetical protein